VSLLPRRDLTINITRDPVKHELTKPIGVDASFVHTVVHDHILAL
jgi:hypothetical protein